MDEALPLDPYTGEFFKEFFMGRLRPTALRLCRRDSERAMDLLHDTAKWFYEWKPWEKGLPYEAWVPYTVTVMKRILVRENKDLPQTEALDGATEERVGSDDSKAAQRMRDMVERKSLATKVMPLFDGNEQMQEFIYYRYFCDMTRAEIAEAMGLPEARDVTDLERQFAYRVTPEKAVRLLGLVPKEQRV